MSNGGHIQIHICLKEETLKNIFNPSTEIRNRHLEIDMKVSTIDRYLYNMTNTKSYLLLNIQRKFYRDLKININADSKKKH